MTFHAQHFTCSICAIEKRDTNHWWIVFTSRPARLIEDVPRTMEIREWNEFDAKAADAIHLCSEGCLAKQLSRFCKSIWTPPPGTPVVICKKKEERPAA
jgi:hypothetical protein